MYNRRIFTGFFLRITSILDTRRDVVHETHFKPIILDFYALATYNLAAKTAAVKRWKPGMIFYDAVSAVEIW